MIDAVDETWIAELKKPRSVYLKVYAKTMIAHLQKVALGTHKIDVLDLQDEMRKLHPKTDSVPEYTKQMERLQEQSERANNKISDATLVNIAIKAMLATEHHPTTNDKFEKLDKDKRTWVKWKDM